MKIQWFWGLPPLSLGQAHFRSSSHQLHELIFHFSSFLDLFKSFNMIGWGNTSPLNWLICKAQPGSFLLVFQSNPSRRLLHVKVNRITYSARYHGIDHDLLSKTMVRDSETGETDPRILYELHFGWNFEELLQGNDKLRLRKWWINGDSNHAGNKEHQRNMQQKYFTLFDCLRILNHDVVFQLQCLSESQKHQISQEEWWLWIVLLLAYVKYDIPWVIILATVTDSTIGHWLALIQLQVFVPNNCWAHNMSNPSTVFLEHMKYAMFATFLAIHSNFTVPALVLEECIKKSKSMQPGWMTLPHLKFLVQLQVLRQRHLESSEN